MAATTGTCSRCKQPFAACDGPADCDANLAAAAKLQHAAAMQQLLQDFTNSTFTTAADGAVVRAGKAVR